MDKGRPKTPVLQRFMDKYVVDAVTGCWMWAAGKYQSGYGVIRIEGKNKRAHRVAWELFRGGIPEGMFVLHKCDTPACCNPDHLFIGTGQDNVDDRVAKGRSRAQHGEAHNLAKLTEEDVGRIRELYATTELSQKKIGEMFGVCHQNVHLIVNNKRWTKIGE